MFRWCGLAVLTIAMVLAACGRQVTGLGVNANSIQAGKMLIRVRTVLPQDYTNVHYFIVFNTTGNTGMPYPQAALTGFANYSFAFVIGGPTGLVSQPQLFQYFEATGSSSGIQPFPIPVPLQLANVVPNSSGSSTSGEFTLTFDRNLLFGINPGGSPTPSPSSSGAVAAPTTAAQHIWNINFITTDLNNIPIDSMGLGGNRDATFQLAVDTTQAVDIQQTKPQITSLTNQTAQLTGFEVINAP